MTETTYDVSISRWFAAPPEVIEDRLIVGYEIARGFPGLEDGTRMGISIELVPERDGTRLEL